LQYHKTTFWLYITDYDNFGVAHALYHVTLSRGSKITTRMNFLTHICIFIMPLLCVYDDDRLRGVLKGASPLLSNFRRKFSVQSKLVPKIKMALIRGNGGLNITFYVRDPEKAHPCVEPRVLAYFASKSVQGPWL